MGVAESLNWDYNPKMDQLLHNALGIAVRKLLTPLVRILLGAGVPCGVFVEQVKRV